jgi:hypothetical protein
MPFGYPWGKIDTQYDDLGNPTRVVRVTYNNSDDADKTFITDYDLQSYVPIPMAGEKPVRRVDNRTDLSVVVVWKDETGNEITGEDFTFALGAIYQANITLTAATPDYLFSAAKNFVYNTIVQTQPGEDSAIDKRELSLITYKPTNAPADISDLNLTPYIPKPINSVTPVISFGGPQYTGVVRWKNTETQAELGGPFQTDTAYTAEVTLTPAVGYSFKNIGQNAFIHTGAGRPEDITNPAGMGSVTINFAPTGSANYTIVYDTVLTSLVPKPVISMTPIRTIAALQYTGTVTWVPPHNTFQKDTQYTAVLTLAAVQGYTFTGIGQDVFSHGDSKIPVTNLANSGTVTVAFPPAASATYMVIQSFGRVETENSALRLMKDRKLDNYPLLIDLPGDAEELVIPTSLIAGDSCPSYVLINGHNRVLKLQNSGAPLITVGAGVTLILQNITLEGVADNNAPLLEVQPGGNLTLGTGAVVTHNTSTGNTGGVFVNGGSLVMSDGAIISKMSAQQAGGVLIDRNGRFSMNGGTIGGDNGDGNIASGIRSGGGVLVNKGFFDMGGGLIQSNSTTEAYSSGGVCVNGTGIFNMYNGTIKDNNAAAKESGGGVGVLYSDDNENFEYDGRGTFNLYNGTIQGNSAQAKSSGGGVYTNGTFFMRGGLITGNTTAAATCSGRNYGVYVDSGESFDLDLFTMSGSPRITPDNVVALGSTIIVLDGILDCPDAINVVIDESAYDRNDDEPPDSYDAIDDFADTQKEILRARDPAYITENAGKFLFYDTPNCISLYDPDWVYYYGIYSSGIGI